MLNLILRFVINIVGVFLAAQFVPGIDLVLEPINLGMVAVVYGLINALIRPVFKLLTCPLQIVTLGLFTFIINALMLMLTAYIVGNGLQVEGFIPALLGSIVISIVSTILSWILPSWRDDEK